MENFKRRSGKCITILTYIIPTLNVIASTLKISRDVNSIITKLHCGILILRQKENWLQLVQRSKHYKGDTIKLVFSSASIGLLINQWQAQGYWAWV